MPIDQLSNTTLDLANQDPDFAVQIAFSLWKQTVFDPMAAYATSLQLPSQSSASSANTPKDPAVAPLQKPRVLAPTGYSSWSDYFSAVFDPVQFAETEDASLCGLAAATVTVSTAGLVRFNSNNMYFNMGKTTGYVAVAAEAVAVGGWAMSTYGVQLSVLTPGTTGPIYPALGLEASVSGGAWGNIIKVALDNARSPYPYIGLFNTGFLGAQSWEQNGKQIVGTFIHWYADGNISPFIPGRGYIDIQGPGINELPVLSDVLPQVYNHYVINVNQNQPWNVPSPITDAGRSSSIREELDEARNV